MEENHRTVNVTMAIKKARLVSSVWLKWRGSFFIWSPTWFWFFAGCFIIFRHFFPFIFWFHYKYYHTINNDHNILAIGGLIGEVTGVSLLRNDLFEEKENLNRIFVNVKFAEELEMVYTVSKKWKADEMFWAVP